MKGVILAGGTGSRLMPLTQVTNKHLLPIHDKPMIFYPLDLLRNAGITDIMVITGTHHAGAIFQLLGSGSKFGCNFTFRVQDEAGGIPQAIALAEDFVGEEKFVSVNGDNLLLYESIKPHVEDFSKSNNEAAALLCEVTTEEASRAGVAVFENGILNGFVEKPKSPPSNWISTGIYFLSPDVFRIIKTLKPSARGELEIVDVQNEYLSRNKLGSYKIKDGLWLDAGTVDELSRANKIVYEEAKKHEL